MRSPFAFAAAALEAADNYGFRCMFRVEHAGGVLVYHLGGVDLAELGVEDKRVEAWCPECSVLPARPVVVSRAPEARDTAEPLGAPVPRVAADPAVSESREAVKVAQRRVQPRREGMSISDERGWVTVWEEQERF
jgi:hypothetical protein